MLWSPVELLKLRAQLQTSRAGVPGHLNPAALAGQVLAAEGLPGLYRGFGLTVLRDVPSFALYFFL
jgi:solute carrier family 25 carnitine/acylcarnitine transporter 20/29